MITLDQAGRDLVRAMVLPSPPDLDGVIEYLWYESAPETGQASCRVVPDPSCHLIFKTSPGPTGCTLRLVGPRSVFADIDKTGRRLTVGARFRPGVLRGLFGLSPFDLLDRSVSLSDVVGRPAAELEHRMAEAGEAPAVVGLLNGFLRRRLASGRAADWRVETALHLLTTQHRLVSRGPLPSLRDLAVATSNSPRTLRSVLRAEVGLGFKRWAQIHRLSGLLHAALDKSRPRWAELAAARGYYDQAHLIREHRQLLGETPAQFLLRATGGGSKPAVSYNPGSGIPR